MNTGLWIAFGIISIIIALPLGFAIGYLYKQNKVEKALIDQKDEAEKLLDEAREQVRVMEVQARDQALEVMQKAETDVARRRNEVTREEDRLQKRRE
ncbi:MAG: hypothetical protein H6Q37_949, partial [Chloroflexi bacterium]|nr:hypothetical protein [Chloroflexota bacterium]